MHGVVLCGGSGTRMGKVTKRISNKHLLPVYDRVMIDFPIETFVKSGIKNITIITGERHAGKFIEYIGNGREFGLNSVSYAFQYGGDAGIADALRCAKNSIPFGSPVAVILGDNAFDCSYQSVIAEFTDKLQHHCLGSDLINDFGNLAHVFLKRVPDPERFGVAKVSDGKVVDIVEKPKEYIGDLAVVGLYLYSYDVFDRIETLKPSGRGELEVTDLNKSYIDNGTLGYTEVVGYWGDMGTPDSLLECAQAVKDGMLK